MFHLDTETLRSFDLITLRVLWVNVQTVKLLTDIAPQNKILQGIICQTRIPYRKRTFIVTISKQIPHLRNMLGAYVEFKFHAVA